MKLTKKRLMKVCNMKHDKLTKRNLEALFCLSIISDDLSKLGGTIDIIHTITTRYLQFKNILTGKKSKRNNFWDLKMKYVEVKPLNLDVGVE